MVVQAREGRVGHENHDKVDLRVTRLAAAQWRVLDVHELAACGLTREAIRTRARNGRLFGIYRGVYAVGHPDIPLEGLFLAAVKACGPDAVLSHFSAAALYRLLKWDGRFPEITAPTRRCHPGIRAHKSQTIERTFHKGIPVTTPARTLIDLASILPFKALRRAVNEALNQRLVTPGQLVATNHRGAKKLRRILATAAPTRNDFEDMVHAVLEGLPKPLVNHPIHFRDRTYVPDFLWADHGLILEADSKQFHGHLLARADDAARQAYLEAHGYRVIRVTWAQATAQPQRTRARIEQALGLGRTRSAASAPPGQPNRSVSSSTTSNRSATAP
jgi:very-short-patch-repair endonuclease